MLRNLASILLLVITAAQAMGATGAVKGEVKKFQSPGGVTEECVRVHKMPGAVYSHEDRKQEEQFCSLDFYAPSVALCPKLWSTSPATIVYNIASGPFANQPAAFEQKACGSGTAARLQAAFRAAKYKMSMSATDTSATVSTASLLYYHFSRYFETRVRVPVSVWRTMDRTAHLTRVTRQGRRYTNGGAASKMMQAAWRRMLEAETNPAAYPNADELLCDDRNKVYGILLLDEGHRYGPEINGTRQHGWGAGEFEDFQKTPAFLALRSEKPLLQAMDQGIAAARKDPVMSRAVGPRVCGSRWPSGCRNSARSRCSIFCLASRTASVTSIMSNTGAGITRVSSRVAPSRVIRRLPTLPGSSRCG